MDLQIRQLQQDEWDAYAHTVQIGLSFQATEEELAEWKRMFEFDRSIAALDGSAIVGTGGAFSLDMTLPGGRTIPTGALTAISVLPTPRRRWVGRPEMAVSAPVGIVRPPGRVMSSETAPPVPTIALPSSAAMLRSNSNMRFHSASSSSVAWKLSPIWTVWA